MPKNPETAASVAAPATASASAGDLPCLPFRVAAIAGRRSTHVRFVPDAAVRARIAAALDLQELPQLSFDGEITPHGKRDLQLMGKLVATVVQPCSITLEPVRTRIAEAVRRLYLADYAVSEADEVEIPGDDTIDPLPEVIDAAAVVIEALLLALPMYPRAPGVELGEAMSAPPGAEPLRQADLRPFAGLAGLVAKAQGKRGAE